MSLLVRIERLPRRFHLDACELGHCFPVPLHQGSPQSLFLDVLWVVRLTTREFGLLECHIISTDRESRSEIVRLAGLASLVWLVGTILSPNECQADWSTRPRMTTSSCCLRQAKEFEPMAGFWIERLLQASTTGSVACISLRRTGQHCLNPYTLSIFGVWTPFYALVALASSLETFVLPLPIVPWRLDVCNFSQVSARQSYVLTRR